MRGDTSGRGAKFRPAFRGGKMEKESPLEVARQRLRQSQALAPFEDVLLHYDWPNRDEHLAWVATAEEREIVEWALTVEMSD